jgi:hypothetical protein
MDDVKLPNAFIYSRGESKSIVSFIPRGNKVLLKLTYKNGIMGIRALHAGNEKYKQHEIEKVQYKVVGFGEMVKNLEIGDNVFVTVQPEVIVPIPENKNDLASIIEELNKLTSSEEQELVTSGTKYEVIEYGVYTEFQIAGIIAK